MNIYIISSLPTLVQAPNNNKAMLIAGGKLLIMFIPCYNLNCAIVSFQSLVHRQVTRGCQALCSAAYNTKLQTLLL